MVWDFKMKWMKILMTELDNYYSLAIDVPKHQCSAVEELQLLENRSESRS